MRATVFSSWKSKKTTKKNLLWLCCCFQHLPFFNQYLKNGGRERKGLRQGDYLETGDACWDCCCAWSVVEEAEEYDDGRTAVAAWLRNCV